MPDTRSHRGAHPEERFRFDERHRRVLRTAVDELSWLLGRDYGDDSALELADALTRARPPHTWTLDPGSDSPGPE